jgi:hypothetical protein
VQADVTRDRPSTTDGRADVDRGIDEQETSRQEHHHTESTLDVTAEHRTDTAASTSTDFQLHDSTVDEQGDAPTTDGQTNVD